MSETRELADAVVGTAAPAPVLAAARGLLLDHLAAAAASGADPAVEAVAALGEPDGATHTVRVPGRDGHFDVFGAALVIAVAAGVGTCGSGATDTAGRFAAPALGAALAVGQARGASGARLLTAFALGCELHLRAAHALDPALRDTGWDPTGPAGVLGAATAASLLSGGDTDPVQLAAAWGVAGGQTLGHRLGADAGLAGLHAGQAAANGALAGLLVDAGFTASARVFEAPRGMFTALVGNPEASGRLAGWGERWALLDLPAVDTLAERTMAALAGRSTALVAAVDRFDAADEPAGLDRLLAATAPAGTEAR